MEEKKDNQIYETIRNIYEKPTRTEPFQEEKGNPIEAVDEGLLALHGENPDCVAWLAVEERLLIIRLCTAHRIRTTISSVIFMENGQQMVPYL